MFKIKNKYVNKFNNDLIDVAISLLVSLHGLLEMFYGYNIKNVKTEIPTLPYKNIKLECRSAFQ